MLQDRVRAMESVAELIKTRGSKRELSPDTSLFGTTWNDWNCYREEPSISHDEIRWNFDVMNNFGKIGIGDNTPILNFLHAS